MEQAKNASLNVDDDMHTMGVASTEQPSKRMRIEDVGSTPEEILWKSSAQKDRAMANFFRRRSMNLEIEFYQEMMNIESIGEAMKRNIRTKLNNLIVKKMDDKYDDIAF